jgi:hypothetical protein
VFLQQMFENTVIKFHEFPLSGSPFTACALKDRRMDGRTDGRTDGQDEANSHFPQFCKRF